MNFKIRSKTDFGGLYSISKSTKFKLRSYYVLGVMLKYNLTILVFFLNF